MAAIVRSYKQGDIPTLRKRFKPFKLEDGTSEYCLEVTDTSCTLFRCMPLGKMVGLQTNVLPHTIGAASFTLKRPGQMISRDVLVTVSRDLQVSVQGIHPQLLTLITLLKVDLLTEPTVREAMLDGPSFGCEFARTPSNRAIRTNIIEAIASEDSSRVHLLIEAVPSLFVFLTLVLDTHEAIIAPVVPNFLAALSVEEVQRCDSSASSITTSDSETEDAEMAELVQSCECMRNDEDSTEPSQPGKRSLKPAILRAHSDSSDLVQLSPNHCFLLDVAETLTTGNLFNSRRLKRSTKRQVADWNVLDIDGSFELRVLISSASQTFAAGLQMPSEVLSYRISTNGSSATAMGVSRLSNLPWNAHTLISFASDPSSLAAAVTPTAQSGASAIGEASPLQKRIWVVSTTCIHLLTAPGGSAGEEEVAYVFSAALWQLVLTPVLRTGPSRPRSRRGSEEIEAFAAAYDDWERLTNLYCGEPVDFKSHRGRVSGRLYHFYPTRGHLLLGSEVVTMTPHTFMISTELSDGGQGHPVLLVFDPMKPLKLIRAVGGDEIRPTLDSSDAAAQVGEVMIDRTMLDDWVTSLDPGFRPTDEEPPASSNETVADESDFVSTLDDIARFSPSPVERPLIIPKDFTAEREARRCLLEEQGSVYMLGESTDTSTRLRSANLSRLHPSLPFSVAQSFSLSGICSNWIVELPAETSLPFGYIIFLSSETMETVPIGRTELFGVRTSAELPSLGEEIPHDVFPLLDFDNYTLQAGLIECSKAEWRQDLVQVTPNEIRIVSVRDLSDSTPILSFVGEDAIDELNIAVEAEVSGSFVAVTFEDRSVRIWTYEQLPDQSRVLTELPEALKNVKSVTLTQITSQMCILTTLETVMVDTSPALVSIMRNASSTTMLGANTDKRAFEEVNCVCVRTMPSLQLMHCWPLLADTTAPLVLRDVQRWRDESDTQAYVDDLKRRSMDDLTRLSTVKEGLILEPSSAPIVSAAVLDTDSSASIMTLILFETGKAQPLIYVGDKNRCLLRQKIYSSLNNPESDLVCIQDDDGDQATVELRGRVKRVPHSIDGCLVPMRPAELFLAVQPTAAKRAPLFLGYDPAMGWYSYPVSFNDLQGALVSGLSVFPGTSANTSGLIFTTMSGSVGLATVKPVDSLLSSLQLKSSWRLHRGLIEERAAIVPDLRHQHVVKGAVLNTETHKAIVLLLTEEVTENIENASDLNPVTQTEVIIFAPQQKEPQKVSLKSQETATCVSAFVLRDHAAVAVGTTSAESAPRGRLIVGLIGSEFSAQGVSSPVLSVGPYCPGLPEVASRDFLWYSGGSRLFVQEMALEGSSISVSGGSFYEADHAILEVKPIKQYLLLATLGGCEFAVFRLIPIKVQTTFVPFKIGKLASSFLHRNFGFITTTCAHLLRGSQLVFVSGDPFGNVHVSVFRVNKEGDQVASRYKIAQRSTVLHCLDTCRLSGCAILSMVSVAGDGGSLLAMYLTAGGEMGSVELIDTPVGTALPKSEGPLDALRDDAASPFTFSK